MITAYEALAIRIEEAEACRDALADNTLAKLVLSARIAALQDARAEIDREHDQDENEDTAEAEAQNDAPPAADQDPAPEDGDQPSAGSRVAPSAPAPESGQPAIEYVQPKKWTPERRKLLRQLWMERKDTATIRDRLNELPGLPVTRTDVGAYAVGGLKLPSQSKLAAAAQDAPVPQGRERKNDAPRPSDAAPGDVLQALPADELKEAREMMRKPDCGAKQLAEWFGWDLDKAKTVAAAIRDEQVRPEVAA